MLHRGPSLDVGVDAFLAGCLLGLGCPGRTTLYPRVTHRKSVTTQRNVHNGHHESTPPTLDNPTPSRTDLTHVERDTIYMRSTSAGNAGRRITASTNYAGWSEKGPVHAVGATPGMIPLQC
jgi:hypothetical protein